MCAGWRGQDGHDCLGVQDGGDWIDDCVCRREVTVCVRDGGVCEGRR